MKKHVCTLLLAGLCGVAGVRAADRAPESEPETTARTNDTVQSDPDRDYNRFLFLKVNKGKGYRKQGFEQPSNYTLLEKGVGYFSFDLGFRGNDADNQWLEPIGVLDELYHRNVTVNLSGGYFVKNNMAAGVKVAYEYAETKLGIKDADLLSIIIDAKNYETNNAKSTWKVGGTLKNFLPLDYGHRFFLTNETAINLYYTTGLAKNYYDGDFKINKIEKEQYGVSMGITPGIMYFMTEGFAFEFSMSPVLAYYEHTKFTNNQSERGSNSSYGLNFKFLPLNLQFGFSYYFGLDYHRNREHVRNRYNR
ncbi:hypothetical protein LJB87_01375 [Alistipes sp. OttesenSCG-928-L06]|nr:hypothetical protein [Alistipes sp. OttesenSCG-928-L06]